MEKERVYYGELNIKNWTTHLACTDKGLCFVSSPSKGLDELKEWIDKNRPGAKLEENDEKIFPYGKQFIDYIQGKRKKLDFSIDVKGTEFQESVWDELQNIPYGETVSYSDIANNINNPKAVRAVGSAIGANPVLIAVPCHRVLAKNGKISGFRGGIAMKKEILEIEKNNK